MDDKSKIACCLICTLAESMRVCEVCPFKAGLEHKQLKPPDNKKVEDKNVQMGKST